MHITQLRMHNFRNFPSLKLQPNDSLNLIYGDNGAGKSSILEAIHVLGYGRSFRTNKSDNLIHYETPSSESATVFSNFKDEQQGDSVLGFSRNKLEGFVFNINGEKSKRIGDMVRKLPVQIFTPQSSELVTGAPITRRKYIDWLLFHVEHQFHNISSAYNKALLQRNALLKLNQNAPIERFVQQDAWSQYIVSKGESIDKLRKHYISLLNDELKALYNEFNPEINVEIRYNQGWERDTSLSDAMESKLDRDLFRGHTTIGPHKADLNILVNGKSAAEFLSRGQLRVLVSLLLIAEVKLLKGRSNKTCIFLVDDISAELDEKTRLFFLDKAIESSSQLFVTAIEKQQLSFADAYNNKKVFHVKHDRVFEE
ncbi:DNA replication/repair protein RecF [Glaciecola sp. 1036]|uniref:DNA replication/repair protein RecF n=1 Tax=Alteromonadaceae TaxID=72275 RepID=UPI003D00AA45